tara:strand:- start:10293 stop:10646 length:354 start_codon:yes stop_codon:yes gene_type:complete
MQPRLWNRHMTFEEWKLQHHHLNDREALQLYMAEQRLFENYKRDLINQQLLVQNNIIAENIYNLADNISNIFNVSIDVPAAGFKYVLPRDSKTTPNLELITDDGELLITDEGNFLIT